MVLKPGNHSIHSGIIGMNNKRFEFAAKVSGEIFINKKLDLGEKIYQSALKCFSQLGENYNLGIILLCAPIFEILPNRLSNFKAELNFVLRNIDEFQGDLILRAIKESKPAGLLKYEGPGDVCKKKKLLFKKLLEFVLGFWGIKLGKLSEDVSMTMAGGEGLDRLMRGPMERSTAAEGLRLTRSWWR